MDKKNKSLIDDGQEGDIILNESGTSVSLEDIDEAPAQADSSLEDKTDENKKDS